MKLCKDVTSVLKLCMLLFEDERMIFDKKYSIFDLDSFLFLSGSSFKDKNLFSWSNFIKNRPLEGFCCSDRKGNRK